MPHLPPAPHRSRHDTSAHADGTTRWTDGVRALRYALLPSPANEAEEATPTYDLSGRKVNPDGLHKGIYIRNGEKFIGGSR